MDVSKTFEPLISFQVQMAMMRQILPLLTDGTAQQGGVSVKTANGSEITFTGFTNEDIASIASLVTSM